MANALTSEERKILLGIARNVIETYVRSGKIPLEKRDEAALNVQQGCFVTIHRQGRLRGCIGVFT
ncbi:MAG: AMMECR1 domain-containing protein, partial [Deltaproteobacteria bacterium]|nr:AMMECR1 domain-containing protein [Deltaproteobacteria bacterium]